MSGTDALARALVEARRTARSLAEWPGTLPDTLEDAYAVQLAAIALWDDDIAGWKVGRLSPDLEARYGVDRFLGPVFAADIAVAAETAAFAMFAGGSAAFEAEYVAFVGLDGEGEPTIARVTTGIEVASSPVLPLPRLGSLVSVADLGNNAGQIIGAPVPVERLADPDAIGCETQVGDQAKVAKCASALPGGPLTAFAFAVRQAETLGMPLREGQFVSTGAVTGMHAVEPGQRCTADFGEFGRIVCEIVARAPVRG
ncbi:2-keto-4-pentenoate hydratase [Novosphingobium sp. RD2P27]|uniref:2-keto-4-pentenoate hydratase n=1 Tax=Novosphingobium kalidii TaxID=3230299 RepID=A0ABV2D1K1_9SPHN